MAMIPMALSKSQPASTPELKISTGPMGGLILLSDDCDLFEVVTDMYISLLQSMGDRVVTFRDFTCIVIQKAMTIFFFSFREKRLTRAC